MEITQYNVQSCCGGKGKAAAMVLSKPLTKTILAKVMATGDWVEATYQTAAGIFYVENKWLTAFGPFNSTSLQLKCKFAIPPKDKECQQHIDAFVSMIKAME